jgi:hypothetical protein
MHLITGLPDIRADNTTFFIIGIRRDTGFDVPVMILRIAGYPAGYGK